MKASLLADLRNIWFRPVADPDQGYQGLSTGQIFNPKELAELKRELSKAVVLRIYSLLTITIETLSLLINSFSQN